ncbi:Ig-like domain-containing protein, partial [cf. Phormidesmis sp. LEGE 11477]|uniref:Ig-like domain-containing protein n=1 Tax=cf. Phormidesmis sp. LEGE 11477 TaxID=1828680 RepID=UPI001A049357
TTSGNQVDVTVNNIAGNGTLGLSVASNTALKDTAGNMVASFDAGQAYAIDQLLGAPTLLSITRLTPADPFTNADSLTYRVTFDEAVQNVDVTDFVATGTTATITSSVAVADSFAYDITVSGGDLANVNDTVGLDLALGQDITDLVGNALANTEPTVDEVYTVDNVLPTVVINAPADTNGSFTATFEFSEAVNDFTVGDVVVGNGSASDFTTVDGSNYTALITPTAAGNVTIDVAANVATDVAGNSNIVAATQVTSNNAAPIAQNDALVADAGTLLNGSVFADNGSGADTDPDGDILSVSAVNGEVATVGSEITLDSGALLTVNADGSFDYDPSGFFSFLDANETATDSFAYTLSDGSLTDSATATITLEGPTTLTNTGTPFRFSQDTNGGANTFGFDGDAFFLSGQAVGGRPQFQDVDDFLQAAAGVFDGTIERTGTINDQRLANGRTPRAKTNNKDAVKISGRNIHGSYLVQFDNRAEAKTFEHFVEDFLHRISANGVVATDPTDFRFNALGGDSARLFFDPVNDQFGFTQNDGLTQRRFDQLEGFVEAVATDVFGGQQLSDGSFDAGGIAQGAQPGLRLSGGDDVIISGQSVGGRFQFDFGDGATAQQFLNTTAQLFGNVAEANTLAQGEF